MGMSSDEVCEAANSLEFASICVGDVVREKKESGEFGRSGRGKDE
jgi:hypothetical protein